MMLIRLTEIGGDWPEEIKVSKQQSVSNMAVWYATFFLSLSLLPYFVHSEESTVTVPWYENLPAVAMDYKVHIDPGKEDCYYQYVNPGATFYVSFQWRPNSDYQDQASTGGYYSVCIDNQFSRFAAKLVNLYLTVIRYDQWDKFTQEVEELNLSVGNFTESIKGVERNINEMLQYQHHTRGRETWDYNLLEDNNRYVQNWSIIQIIVITATTVLQVYFVRKLFEIKDVRPRA
ncbi:hypothetical protein C0J52_13807 [Blattella germanica]|nr:hypothetical protein C0J52_13807 [Blattella germanica]